MQVTKKDIRKWINALRSGKYEQTKGRLQDSKGYCCLGVACSLFTDNPILIEHYFYGFLPDDQLYSPKWLININDDFHSKTRVQLSELNDHENFTFDEIADLLQAVYLEGALDD